MSKQTKHITLFIIGVFIPVSVILIYINGDYPFVGHDYSYFIPRMIDIIAHYKHNGLSIQWFTPTFGGGLPAFSNPQHTQFFIPQIFSLVVNPWLSILFSIAIITFIGYFFCYKFITSILNFDWKVAIIGSVFFISNGFYLQHLAAGHLTFLPFPLITLAFYLIFSKKTVWLNGVSLGIVFAGMLFSGGVHILIAFALAYIMIFPLIALMYPSRINLINSIYISAIGLITSLLLSSGKLFAVNSFVSHFPRDYFYFNLPYKIDSYLVAFIGFIFQFVGFPLFVFPSRYLTPENISISDILRTIVNRNYSFWEIDVSITFPQIAFLYLGIREIFLKVINSIKNDVNKLIRKIILIVSLLISVWFSFEFTVGYGILFNITRKLPVINAITVRPRYAAAFLFPLLIICLKPVNKYLYNKSILTKRRFGFIYLITLCSFFLYFLVPYKLQDRTFNLNLAMDSYYQVKNNEKLQIRKIGKIEEINTFTEGASSLLPYEAIFGYGLETFAAEIIEGPITLTDGEFLNMTNPYSLVYSEDHSFKRFTKDQYQMMKLFSSYKQPDWNIPNTQIVLNYISGITLISILAYLTYNFVLKKFIPKV